jgi:hypothetical protein
MAYGTFNSIAEVATKFDIKVDKEATFVNTKNIEIPNILFSMIEKNLRDRINYVSEYAICETIIRPILDIVVKNYPLKVWSHVAYNVDKEKGLIGEPDYLVAKINKYGAMEKPALCVMEAKKENFDEGWTQALAEMVASSILGTTTCYGVVTTGAFWQFGKLENGVFIIDPVSISALRELQYIFNIINWIFDEIS